MKSLLVRPIRPDDFAAWRPLWDGYNACYGRSGRTALPQANAAGRLQYDKVASHAGFIVYSHDVA